MVSEFLYTNLRKFRTFRYKAEYIKPVTIALQNVDYFW